MSADSIKKKQQYSVVKSAIYFAFGTFVSRILGLVRDSLINSIFNVTITDAYVQAFRFPNLFRRIFAEGALSACFIPLYVEYREKHDTKSLGQLTAGVLGLLMLTLLPFSIFISLSLDWIIPLWLDGKGFSQIPGKMEMTIMMTRIMFPFLILVSLYAYFMALLNANKKFMLSSIASSMLNVATIVACLWCYWTSNLSPQILSWSVILGGFFQFIILLPALRDMNIPFTLKWSSIFSVPVKRALKAFVPSVLGLGIIQFMAFINATFASRLSEGASSDIYLADRLLELPLSLIAVSLGTAILPSLSEELGRGGTEGFKREINSYLKMLLFLCIPSAVGMWATSDIMVPVLFERGAFNAARSLQVADIVKIYGIVVISASLSRVISQAFYAVKNTLVPSLASLAGLILHIFLAPILMQKYDVNGLVLSTAISSIVNVLFLFSAFSLRYGSLRYLNIAMFTLKSTAASGAILAACWLIKMQWSPQTFWGKVTILGLCLVASAVGYFALCIVFRVQESQWMLAKMKSKLKRA